MDSTWKLKLALLTMCFLCTLHSTHGGLEKGMFKYKITTPKVTFGISKSMYNNTDVILKLKASCKESTPTCNIRLQWVLRFSDCDNAFIENDNDTNLFLHPESSMLQMEQIIRFQKSAELSEPCEHIAAFEDQTDTPIQCYTIFEKLKFCTSLNPPKKNATNKVEKQDDSKTRRKRDEPTKTTTVKTKTPTVKTEPTKTTTVKTKTPTVKTVQTDTSADKKDKEDKPADQKAMNRITKTWQDGRYRFVFQITTGCEKPDIDVTVEFHNEHGYLSATERPLLDFYAVMCAAYTILAFLWLLMMACQWREILRIQFWICGVVLLGLLEKVVFYSEYHHMNTTGYSTPATLVFAQLVSCLKRTVARMLVIIVSMGFGITKPRLGPQLHRVIGVGFLFFVLSSIEACLHVQGTVQQQLVASIPLAVLDAVICYWIFTNLVDTTRTLRLRRNVVKLWLYRHFTNCLIFCIIAAVVFLAWSMKEHKLAECVTRWKELWLDDAYWHILFYIVLVVIIILWRPTANNQRYAYSPLTDAVDDDESKEPMIPDSFEGMKMRSVNRPDNHVSTKVEDDLKWVEDNIPASVADAALAVFDDSDEEIVTNIERSKME